MPARRRPPLLPEHAVLLPHGCRPADLNAYRRPAIKENALSDNDRVHNITAAESNHHHCALPDPAKNLAHSDVLRAQVNPQLRFAEVKDSTMCRHV
jgi:hypothetical protein